MLQRLSDKPGQTMTQIREFYTTIVVDKQAIFYL